MPYSNMLPPLIALLKETSLSTLRSTFTRWFWYSGFAGAYDAASNTRLVNHYRAFQGGKTDGFILTEKRTIELLTATKRNQRALWNCVNCAMLNSIEASSQTPLPEALIAEIDVGNLYSYDEIIDAEGVPMLPEYIDSQLRGSLNTLLVPKRFVSVTKKLDSRQSISLLEASEEKNLLLGQLPEEFSSESSWHQFRLSKARLITRFIEKQNLSGFNVIEPEDEFNISLIRKFE